MRRLLLALVALVLLASGCSSDDSYTIPGPGDPSVAVDTPDLRAAKAAAGIEDCVPGTASTRLPAVTLACLGGGPSVDLSTLPGPMILNFWFAGCKPCATEMPVLAQFDERHGAQVPVIGIDSLDQYPGSAIEKAARRGARYVQLADPGGELGSQVAFANSNKGRPYIAVVDAQGDVVAEKLGGVTSLDELVSLVRDAGIDVGPGTGADGGA